MRHTFIIHTTSDGDDERAHVSTLTNIWQLFRYIMNIFQTGQSQKIWDFILIGGGGEEEVGGWSSRKDQGKDKEEVVK